MKILAIDDDRDVLRLLAAHLKAEGHEIECAPNGHEGLPRALEGNYDLIILDRQLPGNVDGLTLLQILRAEEDKASVLILSGKSRVVDHIEGFRAGTDDYLAKPFKLQELDAAIAAIAAQRAEARAMSAAV